MKRFRAYLQYWWGEHKEDVLEILFIITIPLWIIPFIILLATEDDDSISERDLIWCMRHNYPVNDKTRRSDIKRYKKHYRNEKIKEYEKSDD